MDIKATDVKKLRDASGAGMMEAKGALQEAGGDLDKAIDILKKRGATIAAKKSERVTTNGAVGAYVHTGNKVAALVEVKVETDFVAKDKKFVEFANQLAMHVAGMNPKYLSPEEIPAGELKEQDDPDAYKKRVALLVQPYVLNQDKTVEDFLNEHISQFKENIQINRFVRWELGHSDQGD